MQCLYDWIRSLLVSWNLQEQAAEVASKKTLQNDVLIIVIYNNIQMQTPVCKNVRVFRPIHVNSKVKASKVNVTVVEDLNILIYILFSKYGILLKWQCLYVRTTCI